MNNNQDEFSTPLDARTPRSDSMNQQPMPQNEPIQQSPMPQQSMMQNEPIQQEPMQQLGPTPPMPSPQPPQNNNLNTKKENKDLPIIIVGLILIISVPVIFFFISKKQDNLVAVRCSKENSDQPLITYGVDSYYNNFDINSLEYNIIYDTNSLGDTEVLKVREEMEDLGKEYESEHKVKYIVEKVNDKLVLRIYADKDLIKSYFNVEYGTNKTYITSFLEDSDFKCEEEKVK